MKTYYLPKLLLNMGIVLALGLIFLQLSIFSQETPLISSEKQRQLNEEIRLLQMQKQLAELERDIARANKAVLDAEPKATSTPLKSDVIVSGADIEPEIVVYAEMSKVNAKIGDKLRRSLPSGSTLVIFDQNNFEDWKFYRESFPLFKLIIEDLTESFCVIAQKHDEKTTGDRLKMLDLSSSLARGGNLIGQFADFLSYFRTETKTTGREVKIEESIIVSDLFSKLQGQNNFTLYYPKMFTPELSLLCGSRQVNKPCCVNQAAPQCLETREVYCSETANLFDSLYRARRQALQASSGSEELKKVTKDFEEFNKLLTARGEDSRRSALEKYLNAERTSQIMKTPNVYFLEIKSVKGVGTQRIRKNLFFLVDKLDYSGGIIVEWTLFDKSGKISGSGVETSYDGYKSPKQLRRQTNGQNSPAIP